MESKKVTAILFVLCLSLSSASNHEEDCGLTWKDYAYMAGGAVATTVAAPVVLSVAGFGAAGIGAGTAAAKIMSVAATTGVGTAAVAALQSAGAAGLGVAGTMVTGIAGAVGGKVVKDTMSSEKNEKTMNIK